MKINKIIGFAVGPISSAFFGLITLPIMAWAFSPEDIGRMTLFQVTISLTLLLTVLGLDQAYVREYHESNDKNTLLKACFAPGFLLILTATPFALSFSSEISKFLFGISDSILLILTIICVICNYISRFLSLILRMQERGLAYSMSQVVPKILQIIFLYLIILIGVKRDFFTLLTLTAASMVSVVLVYTWNTRRQWAPALKSQPSAALIRSLLKFGSPLIISGLAYWGLTATSSILLSSQSTLSELGIYSITSSISNVASIFQSIFTVIWAPTVYKWVKEGVYIDRINRISNQALAVSCCILTVVGCASWVTDYILPKHYLNVKYLVVCAVIPPLLYTLSEITCIGIGITRKTILTVWITFTALVCNLLLGLWLIPGHGAAGAVISNALSYLIFFLGRTEVSAKIWIKFPRTRLHIHIIILVGLSISTAYIGPTAPFHYSLAWLLVFLSLLVSFKNEINDAIKYCKTLLSKTKK